MLSTHLDRDALYLTLRQPHGAGNPTGAVPRAAQEKNLQVSLVLVPASFHGSHFP
jgi:hypothetical protein